DAAQQILQGIDRRMDVTPGRVELEVALRDQRFGAEPCDYTLGIEGVGEHLAVDRGDTVDLAGEAAFDQSRGHLPHVARMAGEYVAHGRAVEQRLAARGH